MKVSAQEGREAQARVLAVVDHLATIRLAELHCKAHKPVEGDSLTLLTYLNVRGQLNGTELATASAYRVCAVDDDSEESTPENTVWTVEVTVMAHWNLTSSEVTTEEVQCFAVGQGALACHPFAREIIQSETSRMNYPPATIDLLFNPWAHGVNSEVEIDPSSD